MGKISIICAMSQNGVIGNNNQLLCHIPEDMKFFREKTKGHPVIMGRKTFVSIGKPLPNRLNIVITRNTNYQAEGVILTSSLEEAIKIAKTQDSQEIFIIGGGEIYKQSIALANTLYLTIIKHDFLGDTCFPDYSAFNYEVSRLDMKNDQYEFSFLELAKTPKK